MINYKHLHYFLMVAKKGSIAKASEQLHITPQTISGQLSVLEAKFGAALFNRVGRNLVLTETGHLVLSYANEIFSLGGELEEMVKNRPLDRQIIFNVGITDVIPKSIAYRLLAPALKLSESVRIVCKEGGLHALLPDLAMHKLDLIIADEPISNHLNVNGFNHMLGECGISFFASSSIARTMSGHFPQCLNAMPLLLPGKHNAVREHLIDWLSHLHIYPKIVGEFDDSALMKAFGQGGAGVFIAPTAIATEVIKQYGVESVGQTNEVTEKFYSISIDRKNTHPAILTINETASQWLGLM